MRQIGTTGKICIADVRELPVGQRVQSSCGATSFLSLPACATTTKTLISIFCYTSMGVTHFVAVLG
jgi:hypothetical protein